MAVEASNAQVQRYGLPKARQACGTPDVAAAKGRIGGAGGTVPMIMSRVDVDDEVAGTSSDVIDGAARQRRR